MRFYKNQHQFYIGIDLHARTMYICVINNIGETVFHKNMECSRDNLELVTNTFGKDIVLALNASSPGTGLQISVLSRESILHLGMPIT